MMGASVPWHRCVQTPSSVLATRGWVNPCPDLGARDACTGTSAPWVWCIRTLVSAHPYHGMRASMTDDGRIHTVGKMHPNTVIDAPIPVDGLIQMGSRMRPSRGRGHPNGTTGVSEAHHGSSQAMIWLGPYPMTDASKPHHGCSRPRDASIQKGSRM